MDERPEEKEGLLEGAEIPLGLLRCDLPATSPKLLSKTISSPKLSELEGTEGTECLGRRSESLHLMQPQRTLN